MKNLSHLEEYRVKYHFKIPDKIRHEHAIGRFYIPNNKGTKIYCVVASNLTGWEHLSISLRTTLDPEIPVERFISWEEINELKNMFFEDFETVMLFDPIIEQVCWNYVIHLWRNPYQSLVRPEQENAKKRVHFIDGVKSKYDVLVSEDSDWIRASVKIVDSEGITIKRFPKWTEMLEVKRSLLTEAKFAMMFLDNASKEEYTFDWYKSLRSEVINPDPKLFLRLFGKSGIK